MKTPSSAIRRISIDQLKPGMFLVKVDRSWLQSPFLFHKRLLRSAESIDRLRECGVKEVWIDLSRGRSPEENPSEGKGFSYSDGTTDGMRTNPAEIGKGKSEGEGTSVDHEFRKDWPVQRGSSTIPTEESFLQAQRVLESAVHTIATVFGEVRSGGILVPEQTQHIVCEILEQAMESETAVFYYMQLLAMKDFDHTLYQHVVAVASLSLLVGMEGGFSREELELLGLAALLHDIGYVRLPRNLLRKRVPLSRQEQCILDRHTDIGCEIVGETPSLPDTVRLVISQHHERVDGSGFPRGRKKNELGKESQIVAVVDYYQGLVTERFGRSPLLPAQAVQELYRLGQLNYFDPIWVERFIRVIGVYPIGSFVELSSGERGVVVGENDQDNTRPLVRVITEPHRGTFYDLNLALSESDPSIRIVRYLNPAKEGINLSLYLVGLGSESPVN